MISGGLVSRLKLVEEIAAVHMLAFKIDSVDVFGVADVLHGISIQQDQCSIPARLYQSDVIIGTQRFLRRCM